ncbi:uncharacterized protein [Temnothorax nylanderi]|uniref:uncharacterized protein isoform X2 n=1 Tax=Temnothorax nylanderi TaxID=102681 RepID=UPI003A8C7EA6
MHLYSVCALFLLALVACQAAPSPKVIEKSINEAETTFDKNAILEETGADKGRAKKATTFCVEVRSGKAVEVPCRQEVRQDIAKPLVILPVPMIPGPGYSKPIPPPPQPSPSISLNQQQQSAQVVVPPPAPVPAPAPVQTPAPAPTPIINIVPQAPAPVPCDKPQQPQQPQQIHMVHVIHPQPQPQQRPSVTVIQQEVKPPKQEKPVPKPQNLPIPLQEFNVLPQRPTCIKCNGFIPPQPLNFLVQPRSFVRPTALFDVLPRQVESDGCNNQEESYESNRRPENRIPTLTPYVTSRFLNVSQEPRAMTYHGGAPFESPMPYRSSQMSTENNPNMMPSMMPSMMSNQPIFFPSEETHKGMV